MLKRLKVAMLMLEGMTKDQAFRSLYPKSMIDGFNRYSLAKQQRRKLPDLRPAMNERLRKEIG